MGSRPCLVGPVDIFALPNLPRADGDAVYPTSRRA